LRLADSRKNAHQLQRTFGREPWTPVRTGYRQAAAPAGHESNWLPAPTGNFILWLRVYLPGETVLNGKYKVPPVVEVSDACYEA